MGGSDGSRSPPPSSSPRSPPRPRLASSSPPSPPWALRTYRRLCRRCVYSADPPGSARLQPLPSQAPSSPPPLLLAWVLALTTPLAQNGRRGECMVAAGFWLHLAAEWLLKASLDTAVATQLMLFVFSADVWTRG